MRATVLGVVCVLGSLVLAAGAAEAPKSGAARRMEAAYPGFVAGPLADAVLRELPSGVLLEAGTVRVTEKELEQELGTVSDMFREAFKANAPFFLERMASEKLLLEAARQNAAGQKLDLTGKSNDEIIQAYLDEAAGGVKVSGEEVKTFYDANPSLCGGAPFDDIKKDLETYVLDSKRDAAISAYVKALGQRMDIAVSAAWVEKQAPLVRDNPIDKARGQGKPVLVTFGGASCCGPDPMAATLAAVEEKYGDKVVIISIEARQNQVLMARHGISSIPAQIVLDGKGKEVSRHTGLATMAQLTNTLDRVTTK